MKYQLILLGCLFCVVVQGQTSLEYFIEAAQQNSPVLAENNNLITISQLEQKRLIRDLNGPQLFITGDYQLAPYFNNRAFIDTNPEPQAIGYDVGITNGGLYSGLININQPLWAGKILDPYLAAQQIAQQKYRNSKDSLTHNLIRAVTDQYIKVYQGQELIEMNNNLLTLIEDQALVVNQLAKAALLKRSDVLLIELEKKDQQATLNLLTSQWKQDLMDLYTLCGMADTLSITLEAPALPIEPVNTEKSSFLKPYQTDSLDIAAGIQVFNTKYRPMVNLYGNAGLNAIALDHMERKIGFSAGIGLNLPIYDGHQKELNRQKSELFLNSITHYKAIKAKEVDNNIFKYKMAITALEENIQSFEAQKQDYTTLLVQYKVEINAGQLSVIDYINGLKLYRQVQLNLINSRMNLMMMKNAYNYWNW